MSQTKTKRSNKRQLGQFYTPQHLSRQLVLELPLTTETVILEPSSGNGSFVIPIIERFMDLHSGSQKDRLQKTLTHNVFTVELCPVAYSELIGTIEDRWDFLPDSHNLVCGDFFSTDFNCKFDLIIGNPPFGGTIETNMQDKLDKRYGMRDGLKIKKETYSFFLVRSVEMLKPGGHLRFICSDTFLTISTMRGLREFLLNRGFPEIQTIEKEFSETLQPMVLLDFELTGNTKQVKIDDQLICRDMINLTGNQSWKITESLSHLFNGPKLGDFMVASGGMTIGCNEFFVREIIDNTINEPYEFIFRQEPITLQREIERSRLGYLSQNAKDEIEKQEFQGKTRKVVDVVSRDVPFQISLPHSDYCYYNKSCRDIIFAPPRYVIFWKDEGDAVITFKKSGHWYLRGVGGKPYFKRESLTWQLISSTLNLRYLPPGYIFDSSAPCGFLREQVDRDELWFILGWGLTPLCTKILKEVINHTRNIQSKDFERIPYPFWVPASKKQEAIERCRNLVDTAMQGEKYNRTNKNVADLISCYDL